MQPVRDAVAELSQTLAFPGLRPGLVDFEHLQTRGHLGTALHERVQPGPQQHVLGHALPGLLDDQIFGEPGPGHDAGPERAGAVRVHVTPVPPVLGRVNQPQADLVLEHVRRRIDQRVHGPPQGHPHRGLVRLGLNLGRHGQSFGLD